MYDLSQDSFAGLACLEQVRGIHADALFMSASAVSSTDVCHRDERGVALKRAMVEAATRRFLLVDHTKLGRVALHKIVPLQVFDRIITDKAVGPEIRRGWDDAGVAYEIAT